MSQEIEIVRVRLVGRRWKASFIEDMARLIRELFGDDAEVRLNSFLVQETRFPLTDFDIFKTLPEPELDKLRLRVEELLSKHGYSARRLLAVKKAFARVAPEDAGT